MRQKALSKRRQKREGRKDRKQFRDPGATGESRGYPQAPLTVKRRQDMFWEGHGPIITSEAHRGDVKAELGSEPAWHPACLLCTVGLTLLGELALCL